MDTLFYRKFGKGYPLILIHGFCETHEIWNEFAEVLSKQFEVFTIDLPGFGNSHSIEIPTSIENVGERICDWIKKEKIKHPIVIGHSLGGYVALAMAAQHPEEFAGIGLFHSTAFPDSEERKANRNKVIEFVKKHGTDPFIDTFVQGLFFDKNHSAVSKVDKIARKTSKKTLLAYTAAMRDRNSSIDFIKKYKKPILILGGDKDSIIAPEIIEELGRLSVHPTVVLLKNTGHMAMYESREEAGKIVTNFAMKSSLEADRINPGL